MPRSTRAISSRFRTEHLPARQQADSSSCSRRCGARGTCDALLGAAAQLPLHRDGVRTKTAATAVRPPTSRSSCANCCERDTELSIGIVAFCEAQQARDRSRARDARRGGRGVRRAARGGICARGGRPVLRPVREEPRERPGRRARHHHAEHLLRPRRERTDADELRPDQSARRRETPERDLSAARGITWPW